MGRHRLRPAAHPRLPRLAAPVTMAAALLVTVPAGTAFADDPPPAPVDRAGSLLGSVLGTGGPDAEDDDAEDDDAGDGGPVTGADVAEDTTDEAGGAAGPAEEAGSDATGTTDGASGGTDVTLLEKNDSGVTGSAVVDADRVVATASGLDPDERYVSFFYGATSSATNANPCILDGTNPLPSDQTIGEWEVDEDGEGTLSAANPLGARYVLQAGVMSIRQVEHDFSTATALPVNPLSYSLVACGEVERLEILDPVTDLVPGLPSLPALPPLS